MKELASLCLTEVTINNEATVNQVPTPRESVQQLLTAARVKIPTVLPHSGTKVYTKEKLPEERQRR
jgi:hypothetical protein